MPWSEPARGVVRAVSGTENRAARRPIRVLLVDDSLVARTVLAKLIEPIAELECAGAAPTADLALAFLENNIVDIIVLDVEMPGKDGLTALPEILSASRGARVLIVSSSAGTGATATVRALTLGAADTLLKPSAGHFAGDFARQFIDRLLRIGHAGQATDHIAGVDRRTRPRGVPPATRDVMSLRPDVSGPIGCLAIGASTGGLHALAALLRELPERFTAPILITQHLPPVFMPYFACQLQDLASRPASVACEGDRLVAGRMLIAPGTAHLGLRRTATGVRVALDANPAESRCMPSVDPMFEAVAQTFGGAGIGVVLTGMGRDGTLGARAMVDAGGEILAQNAATSVVWGMPGSVTQAGLASAVMAPDELAHRLCVRAGIA